MKAKNIIISLAFVLWIVGFAVFSIFLSDGEISLSERRPLEQFESYGEKKETAEKRGKEYPLTEYFSWLEDYFLDQFPARDGFRSLSAVTRFYIFNQLDHNGYYVADGSACKLDPILNEDAITSAAGSVNALYGTYFAQSDSDVYYCIIPDKNYFYAESSDRLHYDYDSLLGLFAEKVDENIDYIDIFPLLSGDDYYITDPHWDQAKIKPVAQHILSQMGCEVSGSDYRDVTLENFEGTYSGQLALPLPKENITLLTNDMIDGCTVTDYEKNRTTKVYDFKDFENSDPYDVFLGGAKALLKIENSSQSNGKQLVIFRDSFGSSLAPLLIEGYSEIIVADTRYIAPSYISNFVEIASDCDVLFVYSTSILNSRGVFKK